MRIQQAILALSALGFLCGTAGSASAVYYKQSPIKPGTFTRLSPAPPAPTPAVAPQPYRHPVTGGMVYPNPPGPRTNMGPWDSRDPSQVWRRNNPDLARDLDKRVKANNLR